MTTQAVLERAYALCENLTERRGANFSIGFRHLPEFKLRAVHAAYAFCRLADDLVDETGGSGSGASLELALDEWRAELVRTYQGVPRHPIGVALADTLHRFSIPQEAFEGLIEGCHLDVIGRSYRSFEELLSVYCERVAATIGRISLSIFGVRHPDAHRLGHELSMALQMTNILRDVREDAQRGRVYLPLDELDEKGVRLEDLRSGTNSRGFLELMQLNIERTKGFYERARSLPAMVEFDAALATALMASIYRRILERIADEPERVLRERVELDAEEKRQLVSAETRRWSTDQRDVV